MNFRGKSLSRIWRRGRRIVLDSRPLAESEAGAEHHRVEGQQRNKHELV
ncbi:MAG: hypothetical protein ACQESR_18115 [Planctomycetota bacterium]